jgi:uncharacterized protein YhbP (UPF0306 family)
MFMMKKRNLFIFTSEEDTRHIRDAVETGNFLTAGAIALETKMIGKLRGIQFSGIMFKLEGADLKSAKKAYLDKFPHSPVFNLISCGASNPLRSR